MSQKQNTLRSLAGMKPVASHPQAPKPAVSHPNEDMFAEWYAGMAEKYGLSPDPGGQYYDYRSAMMAGAEPDASQHWPSQFKQAGHPNEIVGGFNTRTGEPEPGYRQETNPARLVEMGWEPATAAQLVKKVRR